MAKNNESWLTKIFRAFVNRGPTQYSILKSQYDLEQRNHFYTGEQEKLKKSQDEIGEMLRLNALNAKKGNKP
jgi:hypothetical protein